MLYREGGLIERGAYLKRLDKRGYIQGPRYDFENEGGGHIREAARFTITLGANKISNFKGK